MTRPNALTVEQRDDGILEVALDTPGSEVNILTGQVVAEIREVFDGVDPECTSAVVFRSAKPRSFINGAQLMLASAVQDPESIFALTQGLRDAYQAVVDAPVPTIAAVQGACYGCGVEFTLCFDHRVAVDGANATFYMTEIADYLDTPAFGSTQRLPSLMGLEHAIGFLMWGHRLWGERAVGRGLVDAVFEPERFDARLDAFVERSIAREATPAPRVDESARTIDTIEERTRRINARFPPEHRELLDKCLDLLVHAARKESIEAADFDRELRVAGQTLVEPQAKAARSFLYLRQLAERSWVRRLPARRALVIEAPRDELGGWVGELRAQQVAGVRWADAPADSDASTHIRLIPAGDAAVSPGCVALASGPLGTPANASTGVVIRRLPFMTPVSRSEVRVPSTGTRPLVELACQARDLDEIAHLYEYLDTAGYAVICSQPEQRFVTDTFYLAFLAPLVAFIDDGGAVAEVEATLDAFGYIPSPLAYLRDEAWQAQDDALEAFMTGRDAGDVRAALAELAELPRPGPATGKSHRALADALLVSMLHAVLQTRRSDELRHVSIADVIARELLGFPVGRTSLAEYLSVERVSAMLDRRASFQSWTTPAALAAAEAYVEAGRNFYR